MAANFNIAAGFHRTAQAMPQRLAVFAGGRSATYGELAQTASRLAGHFGQPKGSGRIGILATRSIEAYAGILAAGWCGGTYVPLNLKWP